MPGYTDVGHFNGSDDPLLSFEKFLDGFWVFMDNKICRWEKWSSRRFESQVKSGIIFRGLDWCKNKKEKDDVEFFLEVFAKVLIQSIWEKHHSEYKAIAILQNLFSRGFSPHSNGYGKGTLLHAAIGSLQPKVFDFLLTIPDINVNAKTGDGKTPLSELTSFRLANNPEFEHGTVGLEMLRKLLTDDRLDTSMLRPKERGGNWNDPNYQKITIMSFVVCDYSGSLKVFRALLESKRFDINQMNPGGSSLLRHAVNGWVKHDHLRWTKKEFIRVSFRKHPYYKSRQIIFVTTDAGDIIDGGGYGTKGPILGNILFKNLPEDAMLTIYLDMRGFEFVHAILSQPDLDMKLQLNGLYEGCISDAEPGYAPVIKTILKDIGEVCRRRVVGE